MVQLIGISKARNNLSSIVKQVEQTKEPVVIVRESEPVAVLQPYEESQYTKRYLKKLLSIKGTWLLEEEYKQIRKELEERSKRLKW